MADIQTTVDAMAKKDTSPEAPAADLTPPPEPTLTAVQIQAVAKELAKPWAFGTCLHNYAVRHGVSMEAVLKIHAALLKKQASDNPVAVTEVK